MKRPLIIVTSLSFWCGVMIGLATGCSTDFGPTQGANGRGLEKTPRENTPSPSPSTGPGTGTETGDPGEPPTTPGDNSGNDGNGGNDGNTIDPGPDPAVTYYRDIQPLLERSCYACHVEGGAGPFRLDTPDDAQGMAPAIVDALARNIMPPYHAKQECRATAHDTRFTEAEKDLVRQWLELQAPLGNPANSVHAPVVALPQITPNRTYDIGADFDVATAREGTNDNDVYRCFDVNLGFTEDTAILGYEVIPDNAALVHHVLAYAIPPNRLGELEANDDGAPGPGYPCESSGVGIGGDTMLNLAVTWVPGSGAMKMPASTGIKVPAGSHLAVQIHYNLLAADGDLLDRTSFHVETVPATTGIGATLDALHIVPVAHFGIDIEAGDANSVQEYTTGLFLSQVFQETRVFAVTGHMHSLGTNVKLEVLRAGQAEDECAFESTWDFNWQRSYELAEPLEIGPADRLRLTCTYDNSAANQPVVNGAQQQPRRVQWGEGSLDEMCMAYLTFIYR